MFSHRLSMAFLAFLMMVSTAVLAEDGPLLMQLSYNMRANSPYTTGLYRVFDAPQAVTGVRVFQTGQYCDFNLFLEICE